MSVPTAVTITAKLNAATTTLVLMVDPIAVSFDLPATGVQGGLSQSGNTLTLGAPAPAGGQVFNLWSSNSSIATVPATVAVAAGATTSAPFTVSTSPVATDTTVTLFAGQTGLNGSLASTQFRVGAAVLASVNLSASTITSGLTATGNVVKMTGEAPAGGFLVTLSSSRPALAGVPAMVNVPAGAATSQPFTISTGYVASSTPVTISATYAGVTVSATLTVTPDGAASVNLSPATVIGGTVASATNSISLAAPAPPAGASVKMTSSNTTLAAPPANVKMAAGLTTSANFKIPTAPVGTATQVTITATYNGISANAVLNSGSATARGA